jgi:hypothetical protein
LRTDFVFFKKVLVEQSLLANSCKSRLRVCCVFSKARANPTRAALVASAEGENISAFSFVNFSFAPHMSKEKWKN